MCDICTVTMLPPCTSFQDLIPHYQMQFHLAVEESGLVKDKHANSKPKLNFNLFWVLDTLPRDVTDLEIFVTLFIGDYY